MYALGGATGLGRRWWFLALAAGKEPAMFIVGVVVTLVVVFGLYRLLRKRAAY